MTGASGTHGDNLPFSLFKTYAALRDDGVITPVDIERPPDSAQGESPRGSYGGWPAWSMSLRIGRNGNGTRPGMRFCSCYGARRRL